MANYVAILFDIGDCYCDDKEWLCFGNNDFCKVVLEWQKKCCAEWIGVTEKLFCRVLQKS